MRSLSSLLAVASLGAAALAAVAFAAPAAAATPTAGTYVPVAPFRAVNTTTGALGNHKGAVTHGHGIVATIGGHGHVPVTVAAVAVTITAVSPTAPGGLVAYAAGTSRPAVKNLLFVKGRNTAVSAIVRTSSSGRMVVFNAASSGSTHLLVDVSGYYVAGTPSSSDPGALHTVAPSRLFDTGSGSRALAGGRTATATLGGHDGIPPTDVGAVAVMISVVKPAKSGSLIAYATGDDRPSQATMHFVAGVAYTEFAIVPTDDKGRLTVYNGSSGSVQVVVDVVGYAIGGVATMSGALQPQSPSRIVNASGIAANTSKSVTVAGHAGVPLTNVSAVLVTITIASPTKSGGVVAWPAGAARPGVTNLQYAAGQTISNVAIVPVSSSGAIGVRNVSSGSVKLYVDIHGYVPAKTITPPPTSTSRYLGDLTEDVTADVARMKQHGCDDATAGSRFVLLDVGAQSVTGPELSSSDPGVALALSHPTTMRLDYADLVTVINSYQTEFAHCLPAGKTATIAVGTNNSGVFSGQNAYAATARGTAWAHNVVDPLRDVAPAPIAVIGASDIENGGDFDTSVTNAQKWENAYLAETTANLIFNGAASGCPSTFGATGGTCNEGWTETQFYGLTHSGTRIQVLPQVYFPVQAVQWANIDATGDSSGTHELVFAGALTQHALDPATFTAAEGWAALVRALSSVVSAPVVPAATDITVG